MNLRRTVNKLQTALIAKGRYITVNQKQFYSDDIERVVTLYEVKEAIVDENGRIWIVYDRERYSAREILLASVTEEDILAGTIVSEDSFLKQVIGNGAQN